MRENSLVVKSNKLIEARYDLNLNEQKIILYAVSKLDRNKEKFNILKLDVREFTELIGTTSERYSEIKEIVIELMKKQIRMNTRERELIANWVSSIDYIKDTGTVELEFSEKLIPYLLQLKEQYTQYQLKNILYLKNKYAIRIYELLKQYQNIGKREFDLDELKKIIGCENKYSDFRNFNKFVLDISKKELCEYTDICFEYEKISKGRKVVGIKFIIEGKVDKDEKLIDILYSSQEIESIKEKSGLENEQFNSKQIMELYEIAVSRTDSLDIDPFEYIRLNYINMINTGTVRSKFAWLKKALENDYAKATVQMKFNYCVNE